MFGWEIKKIIKTKTSVIAIGIVAVFCLITVFLKPILEGELKTTDRNYKIIVDSRSPKIIGQEKFDFKINALNEIAKGVNKDIASKKIIKDSKEKVDSAQGQEYENVDFWKVLSYRSTNPIMIFFMMVVVILLVSNIYINEKISTVENMILSSKNKFKCLNSKIMVAIVTPIFIYGVTMLIVLILTMIQYGMPKNGNLQAFRIVDVPMLLKGNPTIIYYILLKVFVLSLVLLSVSSICLFLSTVFSNSLSVISTTVGILIIGKACLIIRNLPSKLMVILSKTNYIDLMNGFDQNIGMNWGEISIFGSNLDITNFSIGIIGAISVITIVATSINFKKFITN